MYVPADMRDKLLGLQSLIVKEFNSENWLQLGIITGCDDLVKGHYRLLRALRFGDDDYSGAALEVILEIVARENKNMAFIEKYIAENFDHGGQNVSSYVVPGRKIYFTPNVFNVPEEGPQGSLLSAMMPFEGSFGPVYKTIKSVAEYNGLVSLRADDIWENSTVIQDIFSLIYRSYIVVCDFSGRNPNVFYEAGIAHTLGKHVIPITQNADDVPFDLRHHRYIRYLNNDEGRVKLGDELHKRVGTLLKLKQ